MIKVIARIISLDHFADFPGALPANAPIARKTRRVREEAPHACSPSRSEITCLSNSKWLVRKGLCLRQRQRYWSVRSVEPALSVGAVAAGGVGVWVTGPIGQANAPSPPARAAASRRIARGVDRG